LARVEALKDVVSSLPASASAARLRALLPEIDRRIREGVRHDEIVAALNANGFDLTLATFRKALYRWRRRTRPTGQGAIAVAAGGAAVSLAPSGKSALPDSPVLPSGAPRSQERSDFDAVLDRATRDEIGERYLARARPIFKSKREYRP